MPWCASTLYLSVLPAMEAPADSDYSLNTYTAVLFPMSLWREGIRWRHRPKQNQRGRHMNRHLRRWRGDWHGFGEAGEKLESCGFRRALCLQKVCCPELHRDWDPGFWFVHLFKPRFDRIWMRGSMMGRAGDGCERTDTGLLLCGWRRGAVLLMIILNVVCKAAPQKTGDERVEGMY